MVKRASFEIRHLKVFMSFEFVKVRFLIRLIVVVIYLFMLCKFRACRLSLLLNTVYFVVQHNVT